MMVLLQYCLIVKRIFDLRKRGYDIFYNRKSYIRARCANNYTSILSKSALLCSTTTSTKWYYNKKYIGAEKAVAIYYENGIQKGISFVEYDNTNLTEKEKKRVIKGSIYKLLKQITNICPQWGFITGYAPQKQSMNF